MHAVEPVVAAYEPLEHFVHGTVLAAVLLYVPKAHGSQFDAPAKANVPARHAPKQVSFVMPVALPE